MAEEGYSTGKEIGKPASFRVVSSKAADGELLRHVYDSGSPRISKNKVCALLGILQIEKR